MIIKEYTTLYKKDKSDKIRLWKIQAIYHDNSFWIKTEYGHENGKIISSEKQVTEGKNIGKKNETTVQQQLIFICDKTFKDKKEKEEYTEIINNDKVNKSFLPMLADKWDPNSKTKRKIDIVFPCFIQPKLDGIRCLSYLSDDEIINQSRQLKHFKHLYHINEELDILFKSYPNIVLDGELYNHDINFNQIAGIVKTEKYDNNGYKDKLLQIQYHIYDCFFYKENHEFDKRNLFLIDAEKLRKWKYIKFVPTYICNDKNDVIQKHLFYINQKYEGSILRNKNAFYEFTRSKNLQKYKTFEDNEFEIIGFKEGTGHDKGTVIWKCKIKEGKEFDVRPIGTIKERSDLFNNGDKYIGQMLTVTYQELSEFGIPRFPVGKTIRNYE